MVNETTGKLENWYLVKVGEINVLFGNLYEDVHGRWEEGLLIRTSPLKTKKCAEDKIVTTQNSKYLLGKQNKSDNPPQFWFG